MALKMTDGKLYYLKKNARENPHKEWKNVECRNVRNILKCTAIGQCKGTEIVLKVGRGHNPSCDTFYTFSTPVDQDNYLKLVAVEASMERPSIEMAAYLTKLSQRVNTKLSEGQPALHSPPETSTSELLIDEGSPAAKMPKNGTFSVPTKASKKQFYTAPLKAKKVTEKVTKKKKAPTRQSEVDFMNMRTNLPFY